jgi:hypothetical protein
MPGRPTTRPGNFPPPGAMAGNLCHFTEKKQMDLDIRSSPGHLVRTNRQSPQTAQAQPATAATTPTSAANPGQPQGYQAQHAAAWAAYYQQYGMTGYVTSQSSSELLARTVGAVQSWEGSC